MVSRFGNHGRVQPRRIAVELTIIVAVVLVALALQSCAVNEAQSATDDPVYRVAIAMFQHETCTFCPGGDTTPDYESAPTVRLYPFGAPP